MKVQYQKKLKIYDLHVVFDSSTTDHDTIYDTNSFRNFKIFTAGDGCTWMLGDRTQLGTDLFLP